MIIQTLEISGMGTNCYLLEDETTHSAAVVDPGGDADVILAQLAQDGVQVKAILLTHAHYDHTGAVEALRTALPGVPVYLHPADGAMLGGRIFPSIGETVPYEEGDTVEVGALTVKVIHTPGHTPGGVCLLAENALVTGDTLFQGSMGRTDLPGGSYEEMMDSLRRLGGLKGDLQVLPGHMGASTLIREQSANYYMVEAMGS